MKIKKNIIRVKTDKAILIILTVILFTAFLLSFTIGRYPVPIMAIIKLTASYIGFQDTSMLDEIKLVIFQIRLPRILAAVLVGISLSVAGSAYQSIFKNPLVSPSLLGSSAGAGLGAALGILMSKTQIEIQIMAFVCSLITVLLTYLISKFYEQDKTLGLILSGILTGTLCSAGTSFIKCVSDSQDKLPEITFWLLGSLSSVTMEKVFFLILWVAAGLIPIYLYRWKLNLMSIGEEDAQILGVNTGRLRLIIIICATLMTAASVSVSGLIGWIGLVVPHMARGLVGDNYKSLLPASILTGGIYLLVIDDIARSLANVEVPLGILTAFIGAPFFIYLIIRKGGVRK